MIKFCGNNPQKQTYCRGDTSNLDALEWLFMESNWNNSDSWVEFVLSLRDQVEAIALKATTDTHLREDAVQNALMELLYVFPETTQAYERYRTGEFDQDRFNTMLRSYCLNVARNVIISTLTSHTTGNLYIGRTEIERVKTQNGKRKKIKRHKPARYVSLDQFMEEAGVQVSEDGQITWDRSLEADNGN